MRKENIIKELITKNCLENYRASQKCEVIYRKIDKKGKLREYSDIQKYYGPIEKH